MNFFRGKINVNHEGPMQRFPEILSFSWNRCDLRERCDQAVAMKCSRLWNVSTERPAPSMQPKHRSSRRSGDSRPHISTHLSIPSSCDRGRDEQPELRAGVNLRLSPGERRMGPTRGDPDSAGTVRRDEQISAAAETTYSSLSAAFGRERGLVVGQTRNSFRFASFKPYPPFGWPARWPRIRSLRCGGPEARCSRSETRPSSG